MNNNTIEILNKAKSIGLNAVGCHKKQYAHRTVYTIFLIETRANEFILTLARNAGFNLVFDFLQDYGYKYRHGANKLLTVQEGV